MYHLVYRSVAVSGKKTLTKHIGQLVEDLGFLVVESITPRFLPPENLVLSVKHFFLLFIVTIVTIVTIGTIPILFLSLPKLFEGAEVGLVGILHHLVVVLDAEEVFGDLGFEHHT